MDALNFEVKGDSTGKVEEEEEENEKDEKNGDEDVQGDGIGTINQARMFLIGHQDVNV